MLRRFIHNLTTCKPDGSWNTTQMVIAGIVTIAMFLAVAHMEYLESIQYGH